MTTITTVALKAEVQRAVDEIRAAFSEHVVNVRDDGEGGAYVVVEGIESGPSYEPALVWFGFRITFQYPYADVYPHFVDGRLTRKDGKPLGEALSAGQQFEGRPAIQISRRTNNPDPRFENAARKLLRIIAWLRTRP
jgi:hypothetical protein